jgi:hypothetical protein
MQGKELDVRVCVVGEWTRVAYKQEKKGGGGAAHIAAFI